MMQVAPSKNPEKEGKAFSVVAFICGILSLFLWFFAIAGLAAGVRGLILSKRVQYRTGIILSIIAIIVSLLSLVWLFIHSR